MVLSAAAKAARATIAAAIKRKKANIASKRKKYPGLEKKLRGRRKNSWHDDFQKNLQKEKDQRHGQTHRQLPGPRPVTSGGQINNGEYRNIVIKGRSSNPFDVRITEASNPRAPKLTRFIEPYANNKVAWGVIDEFGNKKIRGIGPKAPASYNQFIKKSDDIFDFFKSKGLGKL